LQVHFFHFGPLPQGKAAQALPVVDTARRFRGNGTFFVFRQNTENVMP